MRKRVYIAYTGGTIGMTLSKEGYSPAPGYLKMQMENILELQSGMMPEYTINEYNPLLDSANMTPEMWVAIAQDIADNYHGYDGFVVLHGTDTMAYTASALSFMLEGLNKPVIVTGSQIPICEVRNDARGNLITAILIAGNYNIPEVCLYFGDRLLRGNRTVKVSADELDAFNSPNYAPLGTVGVDIKINWDLMHWNKNEKITIHEFAQHSIGTLRIFPGIRADVVENILKPPLEGVVLETYGAGNIPDQNEALIEVLQKACEQGLVIVACTQCLRGTVDLGAYQAGAVLEKVGVISGFDMTTEAALTKMYYLFSRGYKVEEIRKLMQINIAGELTPTTKE
ncbi:MAG: cytoplasmic asparaginase I [Peptococcaceae bacterium BICA1-8]|nr:MAG: cytoplasmic asparaginase I [Peptococcaceae bacterium BICA1-8]